MKFVDEFRNKRLIGELSRRIRKIAPQKPLTIMEVCGTHTMNACRFGLHQLLPDTIRLLTGPGCPMCVSSQEYIDRAIRYALDPSFTVCTFGDMVRVPGTHSTLERQRAKNSNVFVVYSPLDSIRLAIKNPKKKVIFLAVGFETTISTIALTLRIVKKEKVRNLFFLCSLKTMPLAMEFLLKDHRLAIDGFLCPGHVSAIIGSLPYEYIPERYGIGCCIAGFEPLDIMEGIYFLARQIAQGSPRVENQYTRSVTKKGNVYAQRVIAGVFESSNAEWRGLGVIPKSGLRIRKTFKEFDAEKVFPLKLANESGGKRTSACKCGDVLKGVILPPACPLFSKECHPDSPVGPCMVSNEGTCHAYYRYRREK